jgi:hypothetical protein
VQAWPNSPCNSGAYEIFAFASVVGITLLSWVTIATTVSGPLTHVASYAIALVRTRNETSFTPFPGFLQHLTNLRFARAQLTRSRPARHWVR